MKRRHRIAIVCALALLACAPSNKPATDRVELTYWRTLTGGAGEAQDELVERFNDAQSRIQVESTFQGGYGDLATKIMTASIADLGPNVSQLGTYEIRQFAKAGILVDLRPYLDGINGISTSDWPKDLVQAGEIDGGIYWLPFNVTVPILYYNPDAFEEAAIDAPPGTWTEFYDAARKLTKRDANGRVKRHGLALWNITWPLLSAIWSEGGELTSRDYATITLDDPRVVEVMTAFQDLVREGAAVVPDAASGGHRAAFTSGRAAMILDSPAPYDEIMSSANGFAPMLALYPAGVKGRVYAPGGGGIVMLHDTPEELRDDAWQFMRFLLQPEQIADYAERSGYTAFTKTSQEAAGDWLDDDQRALIHSALPHLRGDFSVNVSPAIRTAFDEAFQRIMIKLEDPLTALQAADKQAEQNIWDELR